MSKKLDYPEETRKLWGKFRETARALRWICLEPLESPNPQQLQAVQTFFPSENLMQVRRRLNEGRARVGPLAPEDVAGFAAVAFDEHGIKWHAEDSTDGDLDAIGFGPLA